MALAGSFKKQIASGKAIDLQIDWSAKQNASNRTATVTTKLFLISRHSSARIHTVNNRAVVLNNDGNRVSSVANFSLGGGQKKLIYQHTSTHNYASDGTLSLHLSGSAAFGGLIGVGTVLVSETVTLDKLGASEPPASTSVPSVSPSSWTYGQPLSYSISRRSTDTKHRFELYSNSGMIAGASVSSLSGRLDHYISGDEFKTLFQEQEGDFEFRLYTYTNSTGRLIGTQSAYFEGRAPSTLRFTDLSPMVEGKDTIHVEVSRLPGSDFSGYITVHRSSDDEELAGWEVQDGGGDQALVWSSPLYGERVYLQVSTSYKNFLFGEQYITNDFVMELPFPTIENGAFTLDKGGLINPLISEERRVYVDHSKIRGSYDQVEIIGDYDGGNISSASRSTGWVSFPARKYKSFRAGIRVGSEFRYYPIDSYLATYQEPRVTVIHNRVDFGPEVRFSIAGQVDHKAEFSKLSYSSDDYMWYVIPTRVNGNSFSTTSVRTTNISEKDGGYIFVKVEWKVSGETLAYQTKVHIPAARPILYIGSEDNSVGFGKFTTRSDSVESANTIYAPKFIAEDDKFETSSSTAYLNDWKFTSNTMYRNNGTGTLYIGNYVHFEKGTNLKLDIPDDLSISTLETSGGVKVNGNLYVDNSTEFDWNVTFNKEPEQKGDETGYCGVGTYNAGKTRETIIGVGVSFRNKRYYKPSSITLDAEATNYRNGIGFSDVSVDGFWLALNGAGNALYTYWRGTYTVD